MLWRGLSRASDEDATEQERRVLACKEPRDVAFAAVGRAEVCEGLISKCGEQCVYVEVVRSAFRDDSC